MARVEPGTSIADIRQSSKVYFQVLDSVLDRLPEQLLNVVRTPSLTDMSATGLQERLYTILTTISEILATNPSSIFMKGLCTLLAARGLIRRQEDNLPNSGGSSDTIPNNSNNNNNDDDDDTSWDVETTQLLFILIGALTLLYIPVPDPESGMAQMRINSSSFNPRRGRIVTWQSGSQKVSSFGHDIALADLLC